MQRILALAAGHLCPGQVKDAVWAKSKDRLAHLVREGMACCHRDLICRLGDVREKEPLARAVADNLVPHLARQEAEAAC